MYLVNFFCPFLFKCDFTFFVDPIKNGSQMDNKATYSCGKETPHLETLKI